MKRFLIIAILIIGVLASYAKFTIHSVNGMVKIERAGQVQQLAKGAEVRGTDKIIIGNNSAVEIHNSADTRVYRCTRPGKYTPTMIMMNARKEADSKVGTIAGAVRFGRERKAGASSTVYEEACMVTRALETYDPEGASVRFDTNQLAIEIASRIVSGELSKAENSISVPLTHGVPEEGTGREFRIENTLDFPLYINVLKYDSEAGVPTIEISELGQPVGCYILLPGQTMMRSHSKQLSPQSRHLLVLTPCYFDIDEVIEKTAESLALPDLVPCYIDEVEMIEL